MGVLRNIYPRQSVGAGQDDPVIGWAVFKHAHELIVLRGQRLTGRFLRIR
jgi:hypothetical protein